MSEEMTYSIEPYTLKIARLGLASKFEVNPNSCGNSDHFKEYLMYSAIQDNTSGMAKTHVILNENRSEILGFISLKATSLLIDSGEKYTSGSPALEIYQLAVNKNYTGQSIGTKLVYFAIATAHMLNESHLGIKYILLAADAQAVGFYEKLEFEKIGNYYQIPKYHENSNCVPMFMQLFT